MPATLIGSKSVLDTGSFVMPLAAKDATIMAFGQTFKLTFHGGAAGQFKGQHVNPTHTDIDLHGDNSIGIGGTIAGVGRAAHGPADLDLYWFTGNTQRVVHYTFVG